MRGRIDHAADRAFRRQAAPECAFGVDRAELPVAVPGLRSCKSTTRAIPLIAVTMLVAGPSNGSILPISDGRAGDFSVTITASCSPQPRAGPRSPRDGLRCRCLRWSIEGRRPDRRQMRAARDQGHVFAGGGQAGASKPPMAPAP